jgi:hypothetical protein
VGAGVGPVPLGMLVLLEPVPGVPEFDGNENDWPGVGAGVGPVPLGTEFCVPPGALGAAPGALPVVPLEPALPELPPAPPEPPEEPPWPRANEAEVSRTAVTNTSVFDCITLLLFC